MKRAKRSGGLHKRSAEDWGSGLRARGGWPPSWSGGGVAGRNRPAEEGGGRRNAAEDREERSFSLYQAPLKAVDDPAVSWR